MKHQILLFSQYSFERFALAMLTFVIFIYLVKRKKIDPAHKYLCHYFAIAFLYEAGHLITYSLYIPAGAYGWYLAALAPFAILFFIQFAYSFSGERCRRESIIVFIMTIIISSLAYGDYAYNAIRSDIVFRETGYAPVFSSKLIPVIGLLFYLWTAIVFIRNVLYHEKDNSKKNIVNRFFFPSTYEGWNGRNFALLVTLDIAKVALLSSYIFFRALPYVTIISLVSAFFLIIYSLYTIVYVYSNLHQFSMTFKVTGSVFIINILIFSVMGYFTLSQFENSYDERRAIEFRYLNDAIHSKNFTALPDEVDFIVNLSVSPYKWIFTRHSYFPKPQEIVLNDFTPGRWRFSNTEQEILPADAHAMKRYFVSINNVNYNFYIITDNSEKYGIGYDYYMYRKSANTPALTLILIAIFSSLAILILIPAVIRLMNLSGGNDGGYSAKGPQKPYRAISGYIPLHQESPGDSFDKIEPAKHDEEYFVSSAINQKIRETEAYIAENYMYDISREGAAQAVGMSPGRFGRAFLTCTGKKFGEYINDMRIEKAKILLEGEASILDIAFAVGFESLSTFSRAFNKNCHVTPTVYREQFHKKNK